MPGTTNPYSVLGISHDATHSTIRKAFHQLSLSHHPDKAGDDPETRDKYVEILEAYAVLGDDARRQTHDIQAFFSRLASRANAAQRGQGSRSSSSNTSHHKPGESNSGNRSAKSHDDDDADDRTEDTIYGGVKADDDEKSFDRFGGYEAFCREFERRRQQPPPPEDNESDGTDKKEKEGEDLPAELTNLHLARQATPLARELRGLQTALRRAARRLEQRLLPFLGMGAGVLWPAIVELWAAFDGAYRRLGRLRRDGKALLRALARERRRRRRRRGDAGDDISGPATADTPVTTTAAAAAAAAAEAGHKEGERGDGDGEKKEKDEDEGEEEGYIDRADRVDRLRARTAAARPMVEDVGGLVRDVVVCGDPGMRDVLLQGLLAVLREWVSAEGRAD